ncbi:hypothetical protein [Sinimarinibacterium sp. NLF-5-8]|uniref:hypothetical protein n=1 Tax=Sinimarinibacterium sp. NLF-5-8 TaxID=2698684 RepID=UPI00137BB489|nr:hypothetical protein [Sinimarinibacterium sp. NLF-5-8]QHS09159.1 hypothetical protein GT972_02635 [Sinimarinibacterium sp. NLF-5-8]
MTPLIREMSRLAGADVLQSSMWFDCGHWQPHAQSEWALLHCPLPYARCAICGYDLDGTKLLLMAVETGDRTIAVASWLIGAAGAVRNPMVLVHREAAGVRIEAEDAHAPVQQVQVTARFVRACLGAFLANTHFTGYQPQIERLSYTDRKRMAKGKAPLRFDWHTVVLGAQTPIKPKDAPGGTHASPRLHDRRAHLRRLPDGRLITVKACKVGKAELGEVSKDYRVLSGQT